MADTTNQTVIPISPPPSPPEPKLTEERDSVRETLETVAFVVFLVLLLKAFVAEAFVIPTGSMATTLFGDHTTLKCERCLFTFTSNNQLATRGQKLHSAECPNCRYRMPLPGMVLPEGGDKVLVLKPQYDLRKPSRHDVFVFKFPGEPNYLPNPQGGGFAPEDGLKRRGGPQEDFGPKNFIKRLWGLPGEKLAIWQGDVFLVAQGADGKERLEIIRREPRQMLAMRRLVNDNAYLRPAFKPPLRSRWVSGNDWLTDPAAPGWSSDADQKTFAAVSGSKQEWLRYRNLIQPGTAPRPDDAMNRPKLDEKPPQPQLITDFLEYNEDRDQHGHWVGDLMVELEAEVQEATGELILELRRGIDRHRAIFDLARGECRLETVRDGQPLKLESAIAAVALSPGKHKLCFSDFDQRLTVWADGKLPFGAGVPFPAPPDAEMGPRLADLYPVSIGAKDTKVKVGELQVWRDIYYTQAGGYDLNMDVESISFADDRVKRLADDRRRTQGPAAGPLTEWERALHAVRPKEWDAYYVGDSRAMDGPPVQMSKPTYYPVQHPKYHPSDRFDDDEYFALGDNSVQSKDSRYWGQVPQRLLMGKAVWVYWPYDRWFLIR